MPLEVFYSYAPTEKDEELRRELEKHLALLQKNGHIKGWNKQLIEPGGRSGAEIEKHLRSAQIILLLVSPDFMFSDYSFGVEMKIALERQRKGEAIVIPIILRPVDWSSAPFGDLEPLPSKGLPVTKWDDQDEALANVAEGIKKIVERFQAKDPGIAETETPLVERNLPKPRVVDAAIPSHVVRDEATELRVLVRLPESEGLKGILQKDEEAAARPKHVRSEPFEVTFPIGPTGKPEPLKIMVKLTSPDFSPPTQTKNIFVPPEADSLMHKFLLTPKRIGKLRVIVELEWKDAVQGGRSLVTMCVSTAAEAPPEPEVNLVQMEVGVSTGGARPSGVAADGSVAAGPQAPPSALSARRPSSSGPTPLRPPAVRAPYIGPGPSLPTASPPEPAPKDPAMTSGSSREGHVLYERSVAYQESGGVSGGVVLRRAKIRPPWLSTNVLVAIIGAIPVLVVGYWQFVYKPGHEVLKNVVLTGQVLNARNAEFVSNAKVTVSLETNPGQFEQFTDSGGGFSFSLGEVRKQASGRIYVHDTRFHTLEKNFVVTEQSVRLELRLEPAEGTSPPPKPSQGGNLIAGRIIDSTKNAGIGHVSISLAGRPEYFLTDDNGNFRIRVTAPYPNEGVRLQAKRAGCTPVDQVVRPPAENLILEMHCTAVPPAVQ